MAPHYWPRTGRKKRINTSSSSSRNNNNNTSLVVLTPEQQARQAQLEREEEAQRKKRRELGKAEKEFREHQPARKKFLEKSKMPPFKEEHIMVSCLTD
jgi:2-polyprenyl-6-methoxyphenol hydroxylase-like FAD-dependent oxidoreductase